MEIHVLISCYLLHEIYKSFDEGYETRSVFLDISKDFDKISPKCLLHKLKENDISGKILNIEKYFIYQRKKRVILNGQYSPWDSIEAGVPQGSILGLFFFLIYINNLSDGLASIAKLFADDTSIIFLVENMTKSTNELYKYLGIPIQNEL